MDRLRSRWIDHHLCRPGSLGLAMPLLLVLTACSGTPFGDRLSGSFPDGQTPAAGSSAAGPAAADSAAPGDAPSAPGPAGSGTPAIPADAAASPQPPAAGAAGASTTAAAPADPAAAAAPAPYRLTLRLAAADPSAPAEAVTRALRSAGLAFEVEVIERITEGVVPAAETSPPAADSPGSTTAR